VPTVPEPSMILKIRILHEDLFAFGPGKAALLDAIARHESISGAGRELGLSYSKTRRLVDEMNLSFRSPLVETSRGGSERGGAVVTEIGRRVLDVFRSMEEKAREAVQDGFRDLAAELKGKAAGG